VPLPLTHSPLI